MSEFVCPEPLCDASFDTKPARDGHYGAAHQRSYTLKPIDHGTANGYRAHNRRSEKACSDCLRAWRKKCQRKS